MNRKSLPILILLLSLFALIAACHERHRTPYHRKQATKHQVQLHQYADGRVAMYDTNTNVWFWLYMLDSNRHFSSAYTTTSTSTSSFVTPPSTGWVRGDAPTAQLEEKVGAVEQEVAMDPTDGVPMTEEEFDSFESAESTAESDYNADSGYDESNDSSNDSSDSSGSGDSGGDSGGDGGGGGE